MIPETVRVPASEVLHIYRPIDAGQIRGLPHVAPAMVRLFLLDQYDDAELDRKKTAAMFAGFITKTAPEEALLGETQVADDGTATATGSDVWLVNAMLYVILKEGLQDNAFDQQGDVEAIAEVVERYAPEEAEKVTGVPAADIVATAREYARERHAAIFYTLGITEHACAIDNIWSLSNLVLMTGRLGYESTGLNALRGQNNVQGLNDAGANPAYLPGYQPANDPEISAKFSEAWGLEVPSNPGFRLDQMMSGLHDGRIKALYLIGENPVQTEPNAHHVEEGMEKLDFVIAQDLFLNDSNRKYANVIFPASSFAEKDGAVHEHRAPREPRAPRRPVPGRARGLPHRRRDGRGARGELARVRVGRGRLERVRRPVAALVGHPLRPDRGRRAPVAVYRPRRSGLSVPARAAPVASERRREVLPVEYQPPIEQPDSEYPFVLSTGRTLYHYNSATMTMREDGVVQKQEDPFVEMHPEDAAALGVADGEWVRLVSRRGELEARAKLGERVYPGLVWMALHFAEAKVNWLTHDVGDPLIGTPEYKTTAVRVEPLNGAVRPAAR